MKVIKENHFDGVDYCTFGSCPVKQLLMCVTVYFLDGLIIDTGQRHMTKHILEWLNGRHLNRVILTHHHEDHSGNAGAIKREKQLTILGHPLAIEKLRSGFPILPYQYLMWGKAAPVDVDPLPETIETDRFTLIPIHAPGHSKDHTVFLEKNRGWLFSGDLYLGDRIKYFRADETITDQIVSLKKVLAFDFQALFCAHNPHLTNGKDHLKNKLMFLEDFYGNVQELARKGCSEKEIINSMKEQESVLLKWMCMGNVSFANMVRSAFRNEPAKNLH